MFNFQRPIVLEKCKDCLRISKGVASGVLETCNKKLDATRNKQKHYKNLNISHFQGILNGKSFFLSIHQVRAVHGTFHLYLHLPLVRGGIVIKIIIHVYRLFLSFNFYFCVQHLIFDLFRYLRVCFVFNPIVMERIMNILFF